MTNSNNWKNDPEYMELLIFLIERTRNAKSPLSINQLAGEFKAKNWSFQTISCLLYRIRSLREKVINLDTLDTETKVKMMFALSVSIDENVLKRLRKDADVEIDENNRIKKYKAKNGSIELAGDHSQSAKMREVLRQEPMDSEDDGSMDLTLKIPGSMKRSVVEAPNSFKRAKVKFEDFALDDFEESLEFRANELEPSLFRQPKLEVDPGAEEVPMSESHDAPGTPTRALGTSGAHIFQGLPTRPKSEANDAYTPQIKLLEAMKSLICPLDLPSLSPLLARIEKKIRESSSNTMIPNSEMILAIAVLVTKITNHSLQIQSESVESVSVREFIYYLKAAIMNTKLEGLEGLLEKIKGRIEELSSEDEKIPAEKVATALQATLEVIGL